MVIVPLVPSTATTAVYEFLLDYGCPAYFATVTRGGWDDNFIYCNTASGEALRLHVTSEDYGDGTKIFINEVYIYNNQHRENFTTADSLIRTQHGLVILCNSTEDGVTRRVPYIVITKDNADNTVIFAHPASSDTGYCIERDVFVCPDDFAPMYYGSSCLDSDELDNLTTVVPVIVDGVMNYCPYLNWVVQRQYTSVGEIIIGTHHYWTDGQIALLDT